MSHRRSGAHYLIELLKINYNTVATLRHFPPDLFKGKEKHDDQFICLVRDPRDVMVACYFYYQGFPFFKKLQSLTVQDFIRGKLNVRAKDIDHPQHWSDDMMSDPIGHWCYFITHWMKHGLLVKYEDINTNLNHLKYIENHLSLKRQSDEWIEINHLVSPKSRNKRIGEYKDYLTKSDLNLFEEKAGNLMKLFSYK